MLGEGTTFRVTLRLGTAHLPSDRVGARASLASTAIGAAAYVEEAERWLPDGANAGTDGHELEILSTFDAADIQAEADETAGARIVIADDNADMREYLTRLLGERYRVEAAANGARALDAIAREAPDLVLADVMMPEMDGFALLAHIRDNPRTASLPVMLLSARAGEEATLEGLSRGADDYLVKPFSARELLTRISARLEMARLRREAAERASLLEAVFLAVPDRISLFDAEGTIVRLNPAAQEIAGPERQHAGLSEVGRLYDLRTLEGAPLFAESLPLAHSLRGETVSGVEILLRAADGRDQVILANTAPYFDAAGRVRGAVAVAPDITALRQLERQTHETLQALLRIVRTLVATPEAPPAGVPVRLKLEQDIVELARQIFPVRYASLFTLTPETELLELCAVAGYTPEQEALLRERNIGVPLSVRIPDAAQRQKLLAGEVLVFDVTQPPYSEQQRFYGTTQAVIMPLRLGEQIIGTLGLNPLENVTLSDRELALAEGVGQMAALVIERDRLLRERAEAQATALALREANRRMDDFLGIASHELRTPLTSITANVQIAERAFGALSASDTAALPEMASGRLNRAHMLLARTGRQLTRLDRLVGDLLDVSRIQAGKLEFRMELCDLLEIVREAVRDQRTAWPDRSITLDLPRRVAISIVADADRIGQVVTNYLTNALKYSTSDQPAAVRVLTPGGATAGMARVEVRDTGPGLSTAQQAGLWERFYRVPGIEQQSGSGVGLGLGLYICRTIVERHNGAVGVESVPGQGSAFWFTLPMNAEAAE